MIYLTPGPSQSYPTVSKHIQNALDKQIPSISHRSDAFEVLYAETESALKTLLNIPEEYAVFFSGSASEWWERIVQNTTTQHSFHFINGSFSKRFCDIATLLGRNAQSFEVPFGSGFVEADLQHIPSATELICFTHNETSSGVITDQSLFAAAQRQHPKALIAVDIVSSCPCVPIDFNQIDCAFFSVQKAFGIPSGLGVCIVSPRALEKAAQIESMKSQYTGSFHSFASYHKKYLKKQTPETPNILGMYTLGKVCTDFIIAGGQERLFEETKKKQQMLEEVIQANTMLMHFVKDASLHSPTVTTITVSDPQHITKTLNLHGYKIGGGYGAFKETQIRIANFPAVDVYMMERFCEVLGNT